MSTAPKPTSDRTSANLALRQIPFAERWGMLAAAARGTLPADPARRALLGRWARAFLPYGWFVLVFGAFVTVYITASAVTTQRPLAMVLAPLMVIALVGTVIQCVAALTVRKANRPTLESEQT